MNYKRFLFIFICIICLSNIFLSCFDDLKDDKDEDDILTVTECLDGPVDLAPDGCRCADFDGDDDVDLEDASEFQLAKP